MPADTPSHRPGVRRWRWVAATLALAIAGVVLLEDFLLGCRLPYNGRYWVQFLAFAPLFFGRFLYRSRAVRDHLGESPQSQS